MYLRSLLPFFLLLSFACQLQAQPVSAVDSTLAEIRKIKDDSLRLEAMFNYNRQLWETMPSQNLRVIKLAEEEAHKVKSRYFIAKSYTAYGYTFLLSADYPRALKYFLDALSIWRQLGQHTREVETLIFIANIHSKNDNLDNAKQFAEQAVSICQKQNVPKLEAKALNELAIIYERLNKPEDAIRIYQKGILAAERENDKYFEAFLLGNMGTSYRTLNNDPLALKTFQKATELGDSMKDPYIQAVGRYNIADIYFNAGKIVESEFYIKKALATAQEINESETIAGSYGLLKRISEQRGDYKQAMDYFKKEVAIKDTVFNRERSSQMAEMQTRFDTKLKDRQIVDRDRQITYTRRTNLFLWLGIALLMGIGLYVWYQQRRTSRLHRQVAAQKQQLEQLNSMQNIIFSVISHDMRTPVNSLLAFMQLLDHDHMTQEKLAAYGAELKTSMTDTSSLLENLLNWAKSQMEGYKPVLEKVDISDEIITAERLLKPDAQRKNIAIQNNLQTPVIAMADINMTSIIIRNLLHNAIKYSSQGGYIYISSYITEGYVHLVIQDNGQGFEAAQVAAFNANTYQVVNSTPGTSNEKGTGLGLLLCRTFLQQMQGAIQLESAPGKGSKFIITIPSAS